MAMMNRECHPHDSLDNRLRAVKLGGGGGACGPWQRGVFLAFPTSVATPPAHPLLAHPLANPQPVGAATSRAAGGGAGMRKAYSTRATRAQIGVTADHFHPLGLPTS